MIIDHNNEAYRDRWKSAGANKYNGAFYYSKEIVKNIIPRVNTDRNWVTINQPGECCDYSIVFIHNNLHPEKYEWLRAYRDLVLVCGVPETTSKVAHLGRAVYLPLSVDVDSVKKYRTRKTKEVCFFGRPSKAVGDFKQGTVFLKGVKRQRVLANLAQFRECYAVGRCAIEAKILDCEILTYDARFPDPSIWKILDNKEAAVMLQRELDKSDKRR